MARLESQAKAGFYPTPPEEMEYILKRLRVTEGETITLLDPCCGEGLALKQWQNDMLQKGARATSYGIEIEKSRAEKARKILDHLEACGYEEMRITHGSISAIYLNPPFMYMNNERMELTFLRDITADYLQEGGILIFNLPQYVLEDTARLLASRFKDIKVYRFTDKNYEAYSQVIVYGIRRRKGLKTREERMEQMNTEDYLYNLSYTSKDKIPTLDTPDWDKVYYTIPRNKKEVTLFQSMRVDKEDIIRSLNDSSNDFFNKVEGKLGVKKRMEKELQVAMPLKITHIATAIASGKLPEQMGDHMLVGTSKQVSSSEKRYNDKTEKEEEVTTISTQSLVRVFSEEGIFDLK